MNFYGKYHSIYHHCTVVFCSLGKNIPTFARRNAYMQASLDGNFRIVTNIDKPRVLRINLIQIKNTSLFY